MNCKIPVGAVVLLLSLSTSAQDATAFIPGPYATASSNFVRSFEVVMPVTDGTTVPALPVNTGVRTTTQYIDGLGRLLQTVVRGGAVTTPDPGLAPGSPSDLVSPIAYDAFGREVRQYLSFAAPGSSGDFRLNPFADQQSFYSGPASPIVVQGNSMFYGKTEYEASPLNRPLRQYAPGDSWVRSGIGGTTDRSVKTVYTTNTSTDGVRIWRVTEDVVLERFGAYTSPGVYAAGTLEKTIVEDEDDKQVITYKDQEGNIILKKVQLTAADDNGSGSAHLGWLCTYYIYDDLSRLRAVIQPRGSELLRPTSVGWNTANVAGIVDDQFFQYKYDEKGRMILKKVPGAAAIYMVYDARDRLVMTQDGNMRAAGQWQYTAYDQLNRPISTGVLNNSQSLGIHLGAAKQSISYPSYTNADELTHTYYDDYSWLSLPWVQFTQGAYEGSLHQAFFLPASGIYPYPITPNSTSGTKDMVTGRSIKLLDGSGTVMYTAIHYDDKGRVIQTRSRNQLGGVDITSTQYSFSGLPLIQVTQTHHPGATPALVTVATLNTYDELGRLIQVDKKVNNPSAAWKRTAYYQYNAMGQMARRRVGTQPSVPHRASLVYEYNVRGWLLGINRSYLSANNAGNAFFGMELSYDKDGFTFVEQKYNGNIAAIHWRSQGDFVPRKYQFTYDAANRLLNADYVQRDNGTWSKSVANFDVKMGDGANPATAYDANGNILSMQQWGLLLQGSAQIDNLSYQYGNNGRNNRLLAVSDLSGAQDRRLGDFLDRNTSIDYSYDANGNMIADANKAIQSIAYNYLNLPRSIVVSGKGTIAYSYAADGTKLRKVVHETAPGRTVQTEYLGGAVYENGILQFVMHEEGRIRFRQRDASFQYDYFLKDHLGNVRTVVTEETQTDAYTMLTFEDLQKAEQNRDWENRTGASINVDGVRSVRPIQMGSTSSNGSFAMITKRGDNPDVSASIGAAKLLKVMAGDRIHTRVDFLYQVQNAASFNDGTSALRSVVNALVGSIAGGAVASSVLKEATATISSNLMNSSDLAALVSTSPATDGLGQQAPRAYLCILFFDERMQLDRAGSRVIPVPYQPNSRGQLSRMGNSAVSAPRNGYAYVYFTNESNVDVHWDNFLLSHERGPILEETHYYSFGLAMQGISSRAAMSLENKRKFNEGTELNEDLGLNWYETPNRSYDPQLGRFWQVDEFGEIAEEWSPYVFGNNNPILYNDPLGLFKEGPDDVKTLQEVVVRSYSRKQMVNLYWQMRQSGTSMDRVVNNNQREWLQRYDGIQRHMDRVHQMTREQDKAFLKGAAFVGSFFVPGGALMKLNKASVLLKLFQGRRGIVATKAIINTATEVGVNGRDADVADIVTGTFRPGISALGAQMAVDWNPGTNLTPQIALVNKDAATVGVDAFTGLVFYGLGKLPVTSKPLSVSQANVKDAVNGASEAVINKVFHYGLDQQKQ